MNKKSILAVTPCPVGVAHTYMAAEGIIIIAVDTTIDLSRFAGKKSLTGWGTIRNSTTQK